MKKDIDNNKQILRQLLVQTQMYNITEIVSLKKGNENKQQIYNKEIEKLIQQLCAINQQLINSKDKITNYCLTEIQQKQQKQTNYYSMNLHGLQNININQLHNCCFIEKKQQQQSYVYLKTKNKLFIFNRAFKVQAQQYQIVFILSQCKFEYIVSYIQLCISLSKIVRVIMPAKLWLKFSPILTIFFSNDILLLLSSDNLKLFSQEKAVSFQFDDSVLIFNKTLWIWDSYNIFLSLKSTKLAIYGSGITNDEQIYTAWRKDIISQQQYCKLIDKTFKNSINWSTCSIQNIYTIKDQCTNYMNLNASKLSNFRNCQVFLLLQKDIVDELYLNGQIIQYKKNQIIYKQKSILDKFYIILQGIVKIDKCNQQNNQYPQFLTQSDCFSSVSFFSEKNTQNVSLIVNSKTAVFFSIPNWKMKFILGSSFDELKLTQNVTLDNYELGLSIKLSQKILKYIYIDSNRSKKFGQKTTKFIGRQKIKISVQLWKKLCEKDLRILYNTLHNVQSI